MPSYPIEQVVGCATVADRRQYLSTEELRAASRRQ